MNSESVAAVLPHTQTYTHQIIHLTPVVITVPSSDSKVSHTPTGINIWGKFIQMPHVGICVRMLVIPSYEGLNRAYIGHGHVWGHGAPRACGMEYVASSPGLPKCGGQGLCAWYVIIRTELLAIAFLSMTEVAHLHVHYTYIYMYIYRH